MAGGEGKRGSSGKAFVVAGMAVAAPLLTVVVVLLCLVILVVAILQSDYGLGTRCVTGSSSWVDWAVSVAKDDKHGYSQPNRGGDPDYDCSSFVWAALRHAGFDVGSSPFNTDGMDSVLKAAGFERSDFRDVASLQAGDVVWADGHTEIYMGDGEFVGAHWDERHGVEGRTPGDQTGDEIGVTSTLNALYTRVYRAPASQGSQAVSGGTSDSGWDGMGAEQAKAAWFGGLAGPGNTCVSYPQGQCTWGACLRAYRLGWKHVGQYWGDGGMWASSAAAEGYRVTRTAPVPGAIVSFPPGVQGADPAAGHVAVVESVDASKGTFTISEMNAHGPVYTSRELPIAGGANFILPKDPIHGAGGGSSSTATCSAGDQDGEKASVEEAKRIAKRKMKDMGWDDGSQFECLDTIFTEESGWRWDATNPDSGAYGIPQSLPAEKMASAGQDWRTNAATQIDWGLKYIRDRYGTPCAAYAERRAKGWY